ncbi:unnamed protein product [Calicophoron daubneyi]|uniref:Sperm microtubule inner protein 1 C-terminal domain-containing protein n=1 Tax=Calicophoron daubneyi TaxID=300641 RepID=A0AAV2TSD4_CALDB
MARITGGTVQTEACLKEQIEKEERAALRFFIQNKDKEIPRSRAAAIRRKKLEETKIDATRCTRLAKEAEERAKREEIARKEREQKAKEIDVRELSKLLDMRPPSPKTKALLYEGISHDGRGRYQYLKARYQKDPEEKFPFPFPMSWDYGWHMRDILKKNTIKKSPYGHIAIVNNTFFTRTGISFGENPEPKPWYAC